MLILFLHIIKGIQISSILPPAILKCTSAYIIYVKLRNIRYLEQNQAFDNLQAVLLISFIFLKYLPLFFVQVRLFVVFAASESGALDI